MSKLKDKIDNALGVDVDRVIEEAEEEVTNVDDVQIQKYNERKEEIEGIKNDLKAARAMDNPKWAEALLKNSAENLVVTQNIFIQEIEDDPVSRNITALGEMSNALVNTINAVQDIERQERKLRVSEKKNDLREKEIAINGGDVIDTSANNILANASGREIMELLDRGIDPVEVETEKEDGQDNQDV